MVIICAKRYLNYAGVGVPIKKGGSIKKKCFWAGRVEIQKES